MSNKTIHTITPFGYAVLSLILLASGAGLAWGGFQLALRPSFPDADQRARKVIERLNPPRKGSTYSARWHMEVAWGDRADVLELVRFEPGSGGRARRWHCVVTVDQVGCSEVPLGAGRL